MSRRGSAGTGDRTAGDGERPLTLSRQVSEQVRSSNQIIDSLRAELADCRRRNAILVREQQETLRAMARLQWIRRQVDGAQRRERGMASPEAEAEELRRRCGRLERELAARAAEASRARRDADYLEAMVQELQAIVELLDRQLQQGESRGDR